MTTTSVSTLSLQLQSITAINAGSNELATLTEELSTGKQHDDISQYNPDDQRQIYGLTSAVNSVQSYQTVNNLVSPVLQTYDTTLTNISSIVSAAQSIVDTSSTDASSILSSTGTTLQNYMKELADDLNQQSGENYIFSGSRSGTQPVGDITALPVPPTETGPSTSPTLASYDTEANGSTTATDPAAYATQSAVVDTNYQMNYGISSNNSAFQNIALGLRYAYAATQDYSNYSTYMNQAQSLLATGANELDNVQASNAANVNTLKTLSNQQSDTLTELQTQLGDVQDANATTVSTQISYLQTQLEASFSATSILSKLSLASYLLS